MKYFIPFILLVLFSCSKKKTETDLEKIGLQGKVKKLVERTSRASVEDSAWVELDILAVSEYHYNEDGYVILWKYEVPAYQYSELYSYDKNGNPLKVFISDPSDTSTSHCMNTLTKAGLIAEEKWIDNKGQQEFRYVNSYNAKNQVIETKAFDSQDSIKSIRKFTYNKDGLQDSVKSFDEFGHLQQYTTKSFEGKWLKGSKSYILELDIPNHLAYTNQSVFIEKDQQGNWLKSYMTTENKRSNETVFRIISRDIIYY